MSDDTAWIKQLNCVYPGFTGSWNDCMQCICVKHLYKLCIASISSILVYKSNFSFKTRKKCYVTWYTKIWQSEWKLNYIKLCH